MSASSSNSNRSSRIRNLPYRYRDGIADVAVSLDFDEQPRNAGRRRRLNDNIANDEDNLILRRPTRRHRVRNREVSGNDDIQMYEPVNVHIPRNENISFQLSTIVDNYRNMEEILNWRNEEPTVMEIYEEMSISREFKRYYREQLQYTNYFAARRLNGNIIREEEIIDHYCGEMSNKCLHCGSLFFKEERNCSGKYTICCELGKWKLPHIKRPTALMQDLFKGDSERSKIFLKNPRFYNNHLSFASITIDEG